MNRIGFSHGKFDILFISGLKTAYWSRVFFFERQLFLMTNSKFQTPLTLTSHNSGSKHRSIENHHIFRFVRTSAFTWYSPCRVYEIRMSRKCGKHKEKILEPQTPPKPEEPDLTHFKQIPPPMMNIVGKLQVRFGIELWKFEASQKPTELCWHVEIEIHGWYETLS